MFSASHNYSNKHSTAPSNKKITVLEGIVCGSISGAIEVFINHPLWTIKIRMQCNDPFTLNLRTLYRGILPSAASMAPNFASQVGLNQFFKQHLFKNENELSNGQKILSAFLAGVSASLVRSPVELILTHQRNINRNFHDTAKFLINKKGMACLLTGLPATAARVGIYSSSFLAAKPLIKKYLSDHYQNDLGLSLSSGIISGLGAAFTSQIFDAIKTLQQANADKESINFFTASKKLYGQKGLATFFVGATPRVSRVVSGICIVSEVNERLEKYFLMKK